MKREPQFELYVECLYSVKSDI